MKNLSRGRRFFRKRVLDFPWILLYDKGEEKIGNSTYVKEYFSYKNPSETAYTKASSTLMAPNETRGSILSVFKQRVQLFASRANLSEMLANNDFDMRDIGRKKTAVFIVIQDEKTTYHYAHYRSILDGKLRPSQS